MTITKVFLDFQGQGTLPDVQLSAEAQATIGAKVIASEIIYSDVATTSPNTTAALGALTIPAGVIASVSTANTGVLLSASRIGVAVLSTPAIGAALTLDRRELCEIRDVTTGTGISTGGRMIVGLLETTSAAGAAFSTSGSQLIFAVEVAGDPNSFVAAAIPAGTTAIEYRYSRRYFLRDLPEISTQGLPWSGGGGGSGSGGFIGTPTDGSFADGLFPLTPTTTIADAFDVMNEAMLYLAPTSPVTLSGDLVLAVSSFSGRIATSPLTLLTYTAGQAINNIIIINEFTATSPNTTKFAHADQGTLVFARSGSDVDSFDLAGAFVEAQRSGNQSYPPANSASGYIRVTAVGAYNGFPAYQKGAALTRVGASFGNSVITAGESYYQLRQVTGSTYPTNTLRVFYDPESGRPGVSAPPSLSAFSTVLKALSGIIYYSTGTTLQTSFACTKCFEYTYVDSPIDLAFPGLQTAYVPLTDPTISGVAVPPNWNDTVTLTNKQFTLNDVSKSSLDARLTVTPRDPIGIGTPAQSASLSILVDTFVPAADENDEYFVDEVYRLPNAAHDAVPSMTGNWTSATALINGEAQLLAGSLIYPVTDFSAATPTQGGGVNYSTFTGGQVYTRALRDNGIPHNSGALRLTGATFADLGSNIQLALKLPSQTGWLDLSQYFNIGSFTGADGDGCLSSHSQDAGTLVLNWTSSTFSTASSGFLYVLRVTLLNGSVSLTQISETW